MKRLIMCLIAVMGLIVLSGCGYSQRDSELVGQVKKVVYNTPLVCPDYHNVDISLGVMRNGVGSMSTQDVWITVDGSHLETLKKAAETGQLVKIIYNTKRVAICTDNRVLAKVELTQ